MWPNLHYQPRPFYPLKSVLINGSYILTLRLTLEKAVNVCWKDTALVPLTGRCLSSKLALWHQSTARLWSGTQKPTKDVAERK